MAEIILSPSFSEILLIWKTILMSVFSSVISLTVILITEVLSEYINKMWLGIIPFYCVMFFKDIQEKHQGDKYPCIRNQ